MTQKLKWKRTEVGYETTNGHWMTYLGEDNKWHLFDQSKDKEIFISKKKSLCQDKAKEVEEEPEKDEPKKEVPRKPPVRNGIKPDSTVETSQKNDEAPKEKPRGKSAHQVLSSLATAVDTGKGSENLDSALRSLYLYVADTTITLKTIAGHLSHIEECLKKALNK
jgi:hypothetical protein